MFLALGLALPFLTGQIKQIGNMLLPMHIPVLLCGFICGWQPGLVVGFVMPLLRSFMFGMPHMYPNAVAMAFELAAYGAVVGFLYSRSRRQWVKALYRCLLAAMVSGRIVWGIVEALLLGIGSEGFTFAAFIAGAFTNSIPGIILQLVLIPVVVAALNRAKLISFSKKNSSEKEI